MAKRDKRSGNTATEEPVLPAYDEGRVEGVHEGEGQSEDPDPRTGEGVPVEDDDESDIIVPKGADRIDAFPSSEVAERIGPYNKTTS